MSLSYDPDSLESSLAERLQKIHTEQDGDHLATVDWTHAVKRAAASLVDSSEYAAYSSDHKGGEWLYDLTILRQWPGGGLRSCPLALESEWGTSSQVSDDFQKLILCRAEHRAIVFEARSSTSPSQQVRDLVAEVEQYDGRSPGDRYLFSVWVRGPGFTFYTHVV